MKKMMIILMFLSVVGILFVGCAGAPANPDQPGPNPGENEISQPRNIELFLGSDTLEVRWDAPSKNPAQIREYEVSVSAASASSRQHRAAVAVGNRYFRVENIDPQTLYEVIINSIPKDTELYTSISASKTSSEKDDVFVLFEGIVVDGKNNALAVSDVSMMAESENVFSGLNGEFQIPVSRNAVEIVMNHTDYSKTTIDATQLNALYASNGLYMPYSDLVLLIQPMNIEQQVIAEEGVVATDDSGEVAVTVQPDTFEEDVSLTLSTPEESILSNSDDNNSGIKNVSLEVVDESGNDVAFNKPIAINIDFQKAQSTMSSRLFASAARDFPTLSDAIRGVLEEADLDFLMIQKTKNGDIVNVNGEFDKDTMNATILANSSGVFSLIPDISVPIALGDSAITSTARATALTCDVDLDIDVFSMELIKKYFGGILTANFEFEVYERLNDAETLVTKKVVQRAYIGVNNIRPVFDMAAMNGVRTGYVNDANAIADTGYAFFADANEATLLSQSNQPIADDEELSGYFSVVNDVQLLDNIEAEKIYIIKLKYRLATPFGRITQRFNIGSYVNGGEEKPPLPSRVTDTQMTADTIALIWETNTEEDFDHFEVYIKKAGTVLPWKMVVETEENAATINSDMYTNLVQNSDYSIQIYTYDAAGLYSIGEATRVTTLNLQPERVNLYLSPGSDAVTSGSVELRWDRSDEPDFEKYIILYEENGSLSSGRFTQNASQLEVDIRQVNKGRLTGLKPETPYEVGIMVVDTAGASSAVSEISVETAEFTPPEAPEIKRTSIKEISENYYEFKIYWRDRSYTEDGYRVLCDTNGEQWELNANTYKFVETMGATPGYTYEFRVEAYSGEFAAATECSIQVPEKMDKPATPTISLVSKTSNAITVEWPEDETARIFRVYVSIDGFNWILRQSTTDNQTEIENLKPATLYTIKIIALNESGQREATAQYQTDDPAPFTGPEAFVVTDISFDFVNLEWSEVEDAMAYYIYRQDNGSDVQNVVGFSQGNRQRFKDSNVTPQTNYIYEVRAYNPLRGGESTDNPTVTAQTTQPPSAPATPVMTAVEHVDDGSDYGYIQLLWTPGDDQKVELYILRKNVETEKYGSYTRLIQLDEEGYADEQLRPAATYTYSVKAINHGGESGWSVESTSVYIEDVDVPPSTPELLSPEDEAEDVYPEVVFVWKKSKDLNEDFDHYVLYLNEQEIAVFDEINDTAYARTLAYNTEYSWKVKAVDEKGLSSTSDISTFKTRAQESNLLYGQLSTLTMTPDSTGLFYLRVKNARGLKEMALKIQYTDLIETIDIQGAEAAQTRFSFETGVFSITLDDPVDTDDVVTVASFVAKSSNNEGTTDLFVLPDSTFTADNGDHFLHYILPGKVNVKLRKDGLATIEAEKQSIMMGESIGLNLNFININDCSEAVIKINKNNPVTDYELTNWHFIPGTTAATEITDEQIIITLVPNDSNTFNLTGDYTLRFLPLEAETLYAFTFDAVQVKKGDSVYNAESYGIGSTYCENQELKGETADEVMLGDTFYGTVTLEGHSAIRRLAFDISYDAERFEVDLDTVLNDSVETDISTVTAGVVSCVFEASEGTAIDEGDLARFVLKAIGAGGGFVQISNVDVDYMVDGSSDVLFNPEAEIITGGKDILVKVERPRLTMEDVQTTVGSTYTVAVNITHIEDLSAFEMYIDYNPEISASPVVHLSDKLSSFLTIVDVIPGVGGNELRIAVAGSDEVSLDSEELLKLEFTAPSAGVDYLMFDPKTVMLDSQGAEIEVELDDSGRILVQ